MTHEDQNLTIQNCSVKWNAYNVKTEINDKFTNDGNEVKVPQGYYTFSSSKNFLAAEGITIEKNVDDSVNLTADKDLNLKKFGVLIGFVENQNITKNTKTKGLSPVALGMYLNEIDVHCSLVDIFHNFDHEGEPSDFLFSIPVDTSQPLFGSITHYDFKNVNVPSKHFYGHDIDFEVFSSIYSNEFDYKIYLRLGIE